MQANVTSLTVNPMFLRHDLLIELGRLEVAIGDVRQASANEAAQLSELEMRRAAVNDTLRLLHA